MHITSNNWWFTRATYVVYGHFWHVALEGRGELCGDTQACIQLLYTWVPMHTHTGGDQIWENLKNSIFNKGGHIGSTMW